MDRAITKHGIGADQVKRHQKKLSKELLEIRLVPKQIDHLSNIVRAQANEVRAQERAVAKICINNAKESVT